MTSLTCQASRVEIHRVAERGTNDASLRNEVQLVSPPPEGITDVLVQQVEGGEASGEEQEPLRHLEEGDDSKDDIAGAPHGRGPVPTIHHIRSNPEPARTSISV